ncbi:MAG: DegT/DnrJ/EryC1/StrS family aminotransferase [Candidatus Acidiferrales bacterium]
MRIPLAAPEITEDDIEAVAKVLRTSRLSLGPKLEEFEHHVAAYIGARNAVAVSSGTSALHLCMRAMGVKPGDEVIVPSFAFIAVANAVRYEGGIPVFADVDPETLNIDPVQTEATISSRTVGIVVVHTFGCPADLTEILRVAKRHGLFVIEDACEAFGAEYDKRKVGIHGDVGVFGFYPNKQITTGEGGMLVTNDSRTAHFARQLRNQGRGDEGDWFEHTELGYNYRIAEMNCALGIEQLKRIDQILAKRQSVARAYNDRLRSCRDMILPIIDLPNHKISWFSYVVRLSASLGREHRDWICRELIAREIGCGRYFAPIHQQPAYRKVTGAVPSLPVTEFAADRALALPFFNGLSGAQIVEVCSTLLALLHQCREQGLGSRPIS